MAVPELKDKMAELYKELMKDNAQVATGTSPKNPEKIKRAKKTIAQMKTILHERETQKAPVPTQKAEATQVAKPRATEVAKKA